MILANRRNAHSCLVKISGSATLSRLLARRVIQRRFNHMPYRQNTGWTEYLIGSLVVPVESVKLYTLRQIVYGSGQMANYLSFLRSSWVASHQHGTHGKDCGWRPRFWKTYSSFTYAIACLHLQTVLQRPSYLPREHQNRGQPGPFSTCWCPESLSVAYVSCGLRFLSDGHLRHEPMRSLSNHQHFEYFPKLKFMARSGNT